MCVTLNWVVTHLVLTQVNITRSYVCSRFYLRDSPDEDNTFVPHPDIPPEDPEKERKLRKQGPNLPLGAHYHIGNLVNVNIMAFTAKFVCSLRTLAD